MECGMRFDVQHLDEIDRLRAELEKSRSVEMTPCDEIRLGQIPEWEAEVKRLRAKLETNRDEHYRREEKVLAELAEAIKETQDEIAFGAIAHAKTIAELETALLLLARARPHVYRQQHRGAHEQDKIDAVELLRDMKALEE